MELPELRFLRAYVQQKEHDAETAQQGADCHDVCTGHWIDGYPVPIANPMSKYAMYAGSRTSYGINALGSMIVEVEAADGTKGYGVTIGGEAGCFLVEHHLSQFVEGQDPHNIELMWDQMFRASLNYGRKGLPLQALSAVDLALWDLLGKLKHEPVYNLLGGRTKARLPVYSTTARPDVAKEQGFCGAKVPCPYGPAAGEEGLQKNVQFFADWRAKCGGEFPLSLDCYMALSVPYTVRLVDQLRPLRPKWVEEFLVPDDYAGYEQVRRRCPDVMLTTGEHEYTRFGFKQLIDSRCVDILQPDVTWVGGITEAHKICHLAAASDLLVVPHGSSVYSYHLQLAHTCSPVAEFINLSPNADRVVPYFGNLFIDEPLPSNGFVDLDPRRHGFGVTLNPQIQLRRVYARSEDESVANQLRNREWTQKEWRSKSVMGF